MKEKPIEIVKRIPTPNEEPEKIHQDEIIFEEHLLYEQRHEKSNNGFIALFIGLSIAVAIGFYGFNFLAQKEHINLPIQKVVALKHQANNTIPNKKSVTQIPTESHQKVEEQNKEAPIQATTPSSIEPNYYTETLALPTEEKVEIETPVQIATVVTPPIEEKEKIQQNPLAEELATIKQLSPQKEIPKEEILTETKPIEEKQKPIEPVTPPILVSTTPLNIIEIVHEKPMTVEEYDELERIKREKERATQPTPSEIYSVQYETIKPRYYTVKEKDTLATIAKRFYGNALEYKRIVHANRRIRTAKTPLHLGEKLLIPRKDGKSTRRYIIVERGNTLALLAKRFYGDRTKIKKIIRANYKIKNAHSTLQIGQKIYLPQ